MKRRRQVRTLGIDEAGRGCVLGDLCIGAFYVESATDAVLREAGAADSKALTAAKRDAARSRLAPHGTGVVRQVTPAQIDVGNLNQLEEETIVELIREFRPDRVLIDALGHPSTLPKVIDRLRAAVGPDGPSEWVMEPKADAKFPAVGAASIFAKTTRDGLLDAHKGAFGDFGSGYPSDPATRAWLTSWARSGRPWPDFVRTRWATIELVQQQALFPTAGG